MAQNTPSQAASAMQEHPGSDRFRANLHLSTHYLGARDKRRFLLDHVRAQGERCGIVYCATRQEVDALHALLAEAGVCAVRYHSGVSEAERRANREAFLRDEAPIMLATNGFGTQDDKLNVRYVLHYNMPASLEAYYQEATCAGRDGEAAESILLWNDTDISTNRFFLERGKPGAPLSGADRDALQKARETRLRAICVYCMTADCLRACLMKYFGESAGAPGRCGHCSNCESDERPLEVTELAFAVMRCVHEMRGSFGKATIVDVLRGARGVRLEEAGLYDLKSYGTVRAPALQLRVLIELMIARGYLVGTEGTDPRVGYGPRWRRMTEQGFALYMKKVERPR